MNNFRLPNRQQGHISLLMLGMAFVFIACAVMALDTGRLYLEQRRLQSQADMAALEVAAYMRFNADASNDELHDVATDSAQRNGFAVGTGDINLIRLIDEEEVVDLAGAACYERTRKGRGVGDLLVSLTRTVPNSLVANLTVLWPGSERNDETTLAACAGASLVGPQWVRFSSAGGLLDIKSKSSALLDPLMGELLGSGVDLDLLKSSGVANSSVSLFGLAQGLGVDLTAGSTRELLGADVTVSQLIEAALSSAETQLEGNALAVLYNVLNNGNSYMRMEVFSLGDILVLDESLLDRPGALDARLGLGTLLDAAIMIANGSRAVSVSDLTLNLGSLATATLGLNIIEPPVVRFGPAGCDDDETPPCYSGWRTEVQSANLKLDLTVNAVIAALANLNFELEVQAVGSTAGIARLQPAGDRIYVVYPEGFSSPLTATPSLLELKLLSISVPLLLGPRDLDSLVQLSLANSQRVDSMQGAHVTLPQIQWPCSNTVCESSASAGVGAVAVSVDNLLNGLEINLSSSFGLLNVVLSLLSGILNIAISSLGGMTQLLTDGVNGLLTSLAGEVDLLLEDLGILTNSIDVTIYDVAPGTPNLID